MFGNGLRIYLKLFTDRGEFDSWLAKLYINLYMIFLYSVHEASDIKSTHIVHFYFTNRYVTMIMFIV